MNPIENKTLKYVFFVGIPLTLLVAPILLWNSGWAYLAGFTLFIAYMFAAYEGIGPIVRAAEKMHEIDSAALRHSQDTNARAQEVFVVLGENFDKENFPVLYRMYKRNPDALSSQLQSIADAWHEGSIVGAAQALESDLENDSNRVPEVTG